MHNDSDKPLIEVGLIPSSIDLLGISTSMKPAPSDLMSKSATANLLSVFLRLGRRAGLSTALIDLRRSPLPWFDGRSPTHRDEPEVALCYNATLRANAVCCTVPAYWEGYSGVFKNFIDILGGADYDNCNARTVFTGRRVILIVVGTDWKTACKAADSAQSAFQLLGANTEPSPLVLANPRVTPWNEGSVLTTMKATISRLLRLDSGD